MAKKVRELFNDTMRNYHYHRAEGYLGKASKARGKGDDSGVLKAHAKVHEHDMKQMKYPRS